MRKKNEVDSLYDKVFLLENKIALLESEKKLSSQVSSAAAVTTAPTGLAIQFDRTVSAKVLEQLHRMIGIPASLSVAHSTSQLQGTVERLSLYVEQRPFYVVGTTGHSYPIIYASPGFAALTGYDMHAIIGRNCGFLHGPSTDKTEVSVAVAEQ